MKPNVGYNKTGYVHRLPIK